MRPLPGSHSPRPARGAPETCFAAELDDRGVYELWVHPDDTAGMLGEVAVNGRRGRGELVDRLAFADQVRLTLGAVT